MTLRTETRLAIRHWKTHVAVTCALALGLAIAVTLLNLADALVWRPLRIATADRVVAFEAANDQRASWSPLLVSPFDIDQLRQLKGAEIERIAGVRGSGAATMPLSVGDRITPVRIATTAGDFFPLFGLDDLRPRSNASGIDEVVVSETLWTHVLQPAGVSLGDTVSIEAFDPQTFGTRPRPLRITGIAPRGFHFPGDTQVWMAASALESRFEHFSALGLLRPSVTPVDITEQALPVARGSASDSTFDLRARHLTDAMAPRESWLLLLLLVVTAGLLVTVWCQTALSTASSALGSTRSLETRLALGASRTRVVGELLVGPLLVTLVAVPASVLISAWLHSEVVTLLPFMAGRRADFGFLVLLWSAGAGIGFLASQALLIAHVVTRRMRDAGFRASRPQRLLLPARLAAVSSGISLLAVYVAVLLAASFHRTLNYDYGFETSGLVAIQTSAMVAGLRDPAAQEGRIAALVEHATRVDGVTAAVRVDGLPFGSYDVAQDIRTPEADGSRMLTAKVRETEPGLFEVLRVPLIRGRDFRPEETRDAPVAIVSEQVASALWPGGDPLGARLVLDARTYSVVGVVKDFSDRAARGTAPTTSPQVFLPQSKGGGVLIRTSGNPSIALDAILALAESYQAFLRVTGFAYDTRRDALAANERAYARFMALLAWGALLLALVGTFATVTETTRASLKSTAIRMGLGASRTRALFGSLHAALLWLTAGCALGIAGGIATGQLLANSIRNVAAPAPEAILASLAVSLLILAGSAVGPARLLQRLDIGAVLKQDR